MPRPVKKTAKSIEVALPKLPAQSANPVVGIIMGSQSDWATMHHASAILTQFGVDHECRIVSAHRTPKRLYDYAAEAEGRGLHIIIAGAGGAAHLPGMTAAMTALPVLGVPVQSRSLDGLDSLLSIAQMPAGVPVGTLAIGEAGAKNAALLAVSILALHDRALGERLAAWRQGQTESVACVPAHDLTVHTAVAASKKKAMRPVRKASAPVKPVRGKKSS